MKTSAQGIEDLILSEGIRLTAYKDSVGVYTIGIGHAATSGRPPIPKAGMRITRAQAYDILAKDLAEAYEPAVNKALGPVPQHVFDGAVSFHFNTGAIGRAAWVKHYKAGNMVAARRAFMEWRKPPEIIGRRTREAELIFDGKYRTNAKPAFSSEVEYDQRILAALGYYAGPVDGIRGPKTIGAVKAFQSDNGLVVDGIVGPKTLAALIAAEKALNEPAPQPQPDDPGPTEPEPTPSIWKRIASFFRWLFVKP